MQSGRQGFRKDQAFPVSHLRPLHSNDDSVFELWDKPEQLHSKLKEMGTDSRPAARLASRA